MRFFQGILVALSAEILTACLILGLIFAMGAWAGEQYLVKGIYAAQGLETQRAETSEAQAPSHSNESPVPKGHAP